MLSAAICAGLTFGMAVLSAIAENDTLVMPVISADVCVVGGGCPEETEYPCDGTESCDSNTCEEQPNPNYPNGPAPVVGPGTGENPEQQTIWVCVGNAFEETPATIPDDDDPDNQPQERENWTRCTMTAALAWFTECSEPVSIHCNIRKKCATKCKEVTGPSGNFLYAKCVVDATDSGTGVDDHDESFAENSGLCQDVF